jgi:hypothetical protein
MRKKRGVMQTIYHQGHFDGTCFLYSIINAYSSLTKEGVEQSMWEEALKWIPFKDDYVTDTGTQRIDDDFRLYHFTIDRMLREFKKGSNISICDFSTIRTIKDIQSLINKKSVLIYNTKRGHWMVGVDYNDRGIETICSSVLQEKPSKYSESMGSNYNRKYNYLQRYGKLGWLYSPSAIVLHL